MSDSLEEINVPKNSNDSHQTPSQAFCRLCLDERAGGNVTPAGEATLCVTLYFNISSLTCSFLH